MDGTVETRTSGGWFGHVRANFTQEIVSTSAAAGSRFREVGGAAVNVEDRVTGGINYCGIGVRCSVINKPQGVGVGLFRAFFFLCINLAEGGKHGGVM